MASNALNDDLKIRWNAKRSRYLQKRSSFRNIPDRAFDLGRFIANDDVAGFEHALARRNPLIFHGKLPSIGDNGPLITPLQIQAIIK
jgi:hypothetical protein